MNIKKSLALGVIDSSEVFNRAYTIGNVDVISTFAKVFGGLCQIVISVIGFGIIMAAIAKNAINGLYAVNPKFFDTVDDIRREGMDYGKKKWGSGGSGMASNMMKGLGGVLWILCSIFPNVKAMTDFDDENPLDAKAYFLRAIPLLCLQIFIGVFIFFGYPSQVAKYISDFGTGCFDVVLTNVDPLAWVQSLPGKMTIVNFASDNAPDSYGKSVNTIANSMYKAVVGNYNDIEKTRRQDVATKVEEVVYAQQSNFYDKCNDDEYILSVYSTVTSYQPDISRMNQTSPDGISTYAFTKEITEILESNMTTKDMNGHYVYVQLTFTPKAAANESQAVTCKAVIAKTSTNTTEKFIILSGTGKQDDSVSGAEFYANNAQGYTTINGSEVLVSIDVQSNTANIKVSIKSEGVGSIGSINKITGLYYRDTNGKAHPIDSISVVDSGSAATFTPKNATSTYDAWTWGSSPIKKVKGTETETTTGTSEKPIFG